MPETGTQKEDPFVRLKSAFRMDGMMHSGLVKPVFSRLERVRPKADFRFPSHQHEEFEIILVVRGPYDCELNGEPLHLEADTVLVIEPGDRHQDRCRPPLDYAALLFTLHSRGDGKHLSDLRFFREETPTSRRRAPLPASVFLPLLDRIAAEAESSDPLAVNLQDTIVEEFFWRIARAFDTRWLSPWLVPSQSKEVFLARFSGAMARHAHQSLSVPELAQALGLSQRTLSQRCATLLGDSPARLFLRFKIEQARRLLAGGELSVKEVSSRFGFADPYHFSKTFKAVTGYPPSQTPSGPGR